MQAEVLKIETVLVVNAQTRKGVDTEVADLRLTEKSLNFSERVSVPLAILGNAQAGDVFDVHFERA